ncbi:hypothetical protein [Cellulosimicrobium composti]|uniref:hypothetical protein n=1 Tax=Cellulosimicrobium composti TaxID=2672572 RepID=UPI00298E36CD|nr:hypothetical protein [Cellulosimicrobium composti]
MIADLVCSTCGSDDVDLLDVLSDGRRRVSCVECGHTWVRGTASTPTRPRPLPTFDELRTTFPSPEDVAPERVEHARRLKVTYLAGSPTPDPAVAPFWAKYQRIFSAEGLPTAAPQDLKDFANLSVGANPGNMSVFNTEWNRIGDDAAAAQVRTAVEHLLRGPESTPLEDRLTQLIDDTTSLGMKGFKEALLTKVLCIVHPDEYLTILKYTGTAGKVEVARAIWGVELPDPHRVTWTIGRLIVWSNTLLRALVGDGFENQQHAADFLWWAKDQPFDGSPGGVVRGSP